MVKMPLRQKRQYMDEADVSAVKGRKGAGDGDSRGHPSRSDGDSGDDGTCRGS